MKYNKLKKFLNKSFVVPLLLAALITPNVTALATQVEELEKQQQEAYQEVVRRENEMVNLMVEIRNLESDIAVNQQEIADAEINLADALAAEQKQYQDMSIRIQYMYENRNDSLYNVMLTATSFADFLNQMEYANSVVAYDKQLLDSLEATRIEIQQLQADLNAQKAELAATQEQLNSKKASLDSIIADARARKADIDSDLQAAREEAERRAREEAAAREAARAAARAAASAAAANAAAAAAAQQQANNNNNSSGGSGSGGGGTTVTNANPAPVTGVSGSSVVGYANQFVGGPYVWGGNSLTQGVDCSGFVVQVYKQFGIDLSGNRNSSALRSVGQAVSYDHMKAGDIVCYSGHVGIYTGAGTIVEAQSSRAGITNNRSVNCKTILAIRRVI